MDNSVKVFAPATVANVGPGYDVLGLALENIGDTLEMSFTHSKVITIQMPESDLPTDPLQNVAGVAVTALLNHLKIKQGLNITIHKNVAPGSGLGSSASSSAGAVFALNELLGRPLSKVELIPFAMEGEKAASGTAHADNVAPSLLGGVTLVRSYEPLDIINLTYPEELVIVAVHPNIEIKTADSKKILKKEIILSQAVKQWGNLAGLVSGLAAADYGLISRSLEDVIVEPVRSVLIPGFDSLKNSAFENGALGCSISGSGPSVFALCYSGEIAHKVGEAFKKLMSELAIDCELHISGINKEGCKTI